MSVAVDPASPRVSEKELQLLIFSLHGEEFAINLTDAREIMRQVPLTEVPSAPTAVRGILNLRGKVVTVVDLATLLGFSVSEEVPQHIIVADSENEILGILVHEVTGVLRVPAATLKPTPSLLESKVQSAHVRGALVLDQKASEKGKEGTVSELQQEASPTRLILALDLPAILSGLTSHS